MADTFYISNNGNDENNGTSPEKAWETFKNINGRKFGAGDKILLKRNDVFNGSLTIVARGTTDRPIVISAYGEGNLPLIRGAVNLKKFEKYNNGFKCYYPTHVKGLFINDAWCGLARYPSKGFFGIDAGDKTKLTDRELLLNPVDCTGADIRIRAVNWQYEIAKVAKHIGDTLFFENKMLYQCNKDYGYFLDNKLEFLTDAGEWYYSEYDKTLYFLNTDHAPIEQKNVEAVVQDFGINLLSCHCLVVSDLAFEKFHKAGINSDAPSSEITIKNCSFLKIHQDGINLGSGNKKFTISNNRFSYIKGRGISLLDVEDTMIAGNYLSHIGLYPGYGFDGVNNGTGIAVLKTELTYTLTTSIMKTLSNKLPESAYSLINPIKDMPFADEKFLITALKEVLPENHVNYIQEIIGTVKESLSAIKHDSSRNTIKNNRIEEVGLHGIRLDGKSCLCEYNIVRNSLLYMNDGGAIYSWAQNYDYSINSTIRDNIVINAIGNVVATPDFHRFAHGIYLDNKCVGFTIENNIVVGTTWGILANDESRQHIIQNNVCFDNEVGIALSEYFMPGTLYGCKINNNILFGKTRSQRALFFESRISPSFNPATLDHNYYGSSYYTFPIMRMTFNNGHRVWEEFDLKSWQNETGEDTNAKYLAPSDPEDRPRISQIIINESFEPKEFQIDNSIRDHYDIYGKKLGDSVLLKPFSSIIVLDD